MLKPFEGFQSLQTHHCITGSLRHIYEHHGYPISSCSQALLGRGSVHPAEGEQLNADPVLSGLCQSRRAKRRSPFARCYDGGQDNGISCVGFGQMGVVACS